MGCLVEGLRQAPSRGRGAGKRPAAEPLLQVQSDLLLHEARVGASPPVVDGHEELDVQDVGAGLGSSGHGIKRDIGSSTAWAGRLRAPGQPRPMQRRGRAPRAPPVSGPSRRTRTKNVPSQQQPHERHSCSLDSGASVMANRAERARRPGYAGPPAAATKRGWSSDLTGELADSLCSKGRREDDVRGRDAAPRRTSRPMAAGKARVVVDQDSMTRRWPDGGRRSPGSWEARAGSGARPARGAGPPLDGAKRLAEERARSPVASPEP